MSERIGFTAAGASVAAALAWVVACSWRGLVADPVSFSGPALAAALLVAATATIARTLRVRWYGVLPLQVVVLGVWLHHRQHADTVLGGWLPTPHGVAELLNQISDGAAAINKYSAPVSSTHPTATTYLLVLAVLLMIGVDLIACGLRRPTWAGLPVIVALTIPISVLDGGLAVPVYVGTGMLFVLLLAVVEADRALAWGPGSGEGRGIGRDDPVLKVAAISGPALGIGVAAIGAALLISLAVPVSAGVFNGDDGTGGDDGPGAVTLSNPIVDLRRDLQARRGIPLLDVRSQDGVPSYVRIAVLDKFNGSEWSPAPRDLAEQNRAEGRLPNPPGSGPLAPGREFNWDLTTSGDFRTTWLPTPYPTREIRIAEGDWRYDPATLDIANVDDATPVGVSYQLTGFAPRIDAGGLDRAADPPLSLQDSMTKVPDLTRTVADIAEEVTAQGRTTYAKAVLLQNWFRRDGGFTYTLDHGPGAGMAQLQRFITTDKTGYCEQFAAAMAVMARSLGMPARVTVGFLDPSIRGTSVDQDLYTFTSDDLHAWPEIYFRGYGWVRFEPTPGQRTGSAPSYTRDNAEEPVPSATPSLPVPQQQPTTAPRGPKEQPTPTDVGSRGDGRSFPVWTIGVLLILLLAAVPALLRRQQRARRLGATGDPRRQVEELWAELRATATDLGFSWLPDRSVRMVAAALLGQVDPALRGPADRDSLDLLVRLVERARYSETVTLDPDERDQALAAVERWSDLLRGAVPSGTVRRARILPRSAFGSGRTESPGVAADDLTEVR